MAEDFPKITKKNIRPLIKKKGKKRNDYTLVLGGVAVFIVAILILVAFLPSKTDKPAAKKQQAFDLKPKEKPKPLLPWTKKITKADVGRVEETGIVFDSSRSRKQIFRFKLGTGQVIKGWDEAVPKMSLGEKSVLTLPPNFAYGDSGVRDLIPPDSTLIFDVELLGINDKWAVGFEKGDQKFSDEEIEKRRKKLNEERNQRAKEDAERKAQEAAEEHQAEPVYEEVGQDSGDEF
ncbi:hypothetical protein HK096_005373 [Nowakowskiella sp. JEL0078]|nr:hypothetical protein HK096_005373 [Nowakowskiella sp. JEL0078]